MFLILLPLVFAPFTTSVFVSFVSLNSCQCDPKEYFDLSYAFSSETIYFPGQKQFELHKNDERVEGDGYAYAAYSFSMAEHGGTHLDSPFHFNADGWTVDKIPQNRLINVPAVIIDVSKAVNDLARPNEFVLDVKHIIEHEKSCEKIPHGGVVLVFTGWSKLWPNKVEYLGWDNSTDVNGVMNSPVTQFTFSELYEIKPNITKDQNVTLVTVELVICFPLIGMSVEAAKWLVKERHVVGVGIDTASVDPGNTKNFAAHVFLAHNQIYNLENVANLHVLAKKRDCSLHLIVTPLKIVGGTGSPTNILAYCKD